MIEFIVNSNIDAKAVVKMATINNTSIFIKQSIQFTT